MLPNRKIFDLELALSEKDKEIKRVKQQRNAYELQVIQMQREIIKLKAEIGKYKENEKTNLHFNKTAGSSFNPLLGSKITELEKKGHEIFSVQENRIWFIRKEDQLLQCTYIKQ